MINKKLKTLYSSKWEDLIKNIDNSNAAHPLLIKVNEEYVNADIRVMIIGQETDKWNGLFEDKKKTIDYLMNDYYNYFYENVDHDINLEKRIKKKNKRPFWNRKNFKFYEEELKKIFKDKKVSFLWNNVSKIGKQGRGKPTTKIKEIENEYFKDIVKEEIKILKPDIIIFVTGNRYIPIEHEPVKKIKFEPVAKIKFKKFKDILAFRTYHPNARIKNGKKDLKQEIVKQISELYRQ